MASAYVKYYAQQGSGLSDIGPLYRQPLFHQKGSGVGGFFTTVLKYLSPLAASGLTALKEQAIRSGKEILSEIGSKPFKDILQDRGRQAVSDLTVKGLDKLKRAASRQKGSGYIKRRAMMKPVIQRKTIRRRRRRGIKNIIRTIRRKPKTKQIGGRRRRRSRRRITKRKRTLDIFN